MNLNDFVSETIYQIAEVVPDAAERCKELGAIVNPAVTCGKGDNMYILSNGNGNMERRVEIIKMEVSVTETSEVEGQVKAGISVLGSKVNGKTEGETQNVNKVSFQIPVCLPNPKQHDGKLITLDNPPEPGVYFFEIANLNFSSIW